MVSKRKSPVSPIPPIPFVPGKQCLDCRGIIQIAREINGDPFFGYGYDEYEQVPHENPRDCVKELQRLIQELKDDLGQVGKR